VRGFDSYRPCHEAANTKNQLVFEVVFCYPINMELSEQDKQLIKQAKQTAGEFLTHQLKTENTSSVGAAAKMSDGSIYTAPNIYHTEIDPNYICAERCTLVQAYKDTSLLIDTIVAYRFWPNGDEKIVPPCDKCKKFINLFGDPWVIIDQATKLKLSKL
jgi:cytidine deaminase